MWYKFHHFKAKIFLIKKHLELFANWLSDIDSLEPLVFKNYIKDVVMVTGAWIVTGGTNTGVMKHVGEAVRDYGLTTTTGAPVVAIGVATWGCIHKKKELVSQVRV